MPAERKILLGLFAIALGLRVLYGIALSTQSDISPRAVKSELKYAKEVASGLDWIGEPFSPRAPGYPVVLAALYLLSAKQIWLVVFLQAVLGALTVVFVYRLGRHLLDVPFATFAALWFAFHVHHMHASQVFERDLLAVLLLIVVLFLVVRPFVKMRYAVFSGLVYAGLIHVDPQFLLLLPVFIVFIFFKSRYRLLSIQYLFIFLGTVLIGSAPWTIRNSVVYDQPIPVALEARRFLRPIKLVATDPSAGLSEIEKKIIEASRVRLVERNTVEFWRVARFSDDPEPGETASLDASAAPSAKPAWSTRHNIVSILNYGVVLPFFLLGVIFAVRNRNRTALMLTAVVVVYFLMRAYLGGSEKTRLPIDPLLILVGFYGVAAAFRRFPNDGAEPDRSLGPTPQP